MTAQLAIPKAAAAIAGLLVVLELMPASAGAKPIACTSKAANAGQRCQQRSGPLVATMVPSTHHPKANANWPLEVTATLHGKPAKAHASYEFLYGGFTVVATRYPRNNKHFHFRGHFSDELVFPPQAVGQTLTLRVVVTAASRKVNLDWLIQTR